MFNTNQLPEVLSSGKVASFLGVSDTTARKLMDKIPGVYNIPGSKHRRISRGDFAAYMQEKLPQLFASPEASAVQNVQEDLCPVSMT